MKYSEVKDYIESKQSLGIVPGLTSIERLCSELGNPEKNLQVIHVAGTNGKGSTSRMIATILQKAGYRVGMFSSPAVIDYCEIIQINNKNITQKNMGIYMEKVKEACDSMVGKGFPHPTPFEIECALAFLYFYDYDCELVVLEVGMGGREDATNCILSPLVSVITPISMDHMKFLGDDISKIAAQKAGIIKKEANVVCGLQVPEVIEVLERECANKQCEFIQIQEQEAEKIKYLASYTSFWYQGLEIKLPLLGKHQVENCLLAIKAIEQLQGLNYDISDRQMQKGIEETKWPARFQNIGMNPYFYVDGAHNEAGIERLVEAIQTYFKGKRVIGIMGVLKDKECEKMIERIAPYLNDVITVKPPNNIRAMDGLELANLLKEKITSVTCADSVEEAVEISYLLADKKDVILAFGSLTYLNQCMQSVAKRNNEMPRKVGRFPWTRKK